MGINGVDNNIYSANTIRPEFGRYTAKQPVTSPVKIPEIKDTFEKTKTAANDGKFSFLELGKNVLKGTGQFFTDIYKSIVKHPIAATAMIGVGAAIASTPIGLAFLAGGGVAAAAFSGVFLGIKAVTNMLDGKWDDLEKQGKTLGKLIPGAILSTMGAVSGIRQIQKLANVSSGKTIKKAVDLNIFVTTMAKDIATSPFKAFSKFVLKKPAKDGVLLGAMKNNWVKFVNGNASVKNGNFMTKVNNFLFRPNLSKSLFKEPERKFLLDAVNKPISEKGFIDFKFGLGKDGQTRNFFQAMVMALKGRAG